MNLKKFFTAPASRCFLVLVLIGLGWALYTNHTWEDYYITYRASKNLATGHGLTFTPGERVHSFTSPLGVLLPAFASLLTGNHSDVAALWIFRVMSVGAFAGAGVLLWLLASKLFSERLAAALLVVLFATESKAVDFSTNGMETGLQLFFLAWSLHTLLFNAPRRAIWLGCAWAGMMWTRPDSCIYIGALAAAALLFGKFESPWKSRFDLAKSFVAAALVTTVLYLPWLVWAWLYYGSPIPNTIIAKGLFGPRVDVHTVSQWVRSFPWEIAWHPEMLGTTFMPAYSYGTGWPTWASKISFWISLIPLVVWIVPGIRRETRILSFVFCVGEFYLLNLVRFPVPWYLPTLSTLAIVVLVSLVDQIHSATKRSSAESRWPSPFALLRFSVWSAAGLLVAGVTTVFALTAYEFRSQQKVIEEGQRRTIGLWLKAHASPGDTVFLEPLGYIGFFSNLKMLDFPGLCSPEMIAARRRASLRNYPECWGELILDLQPNWLVLRSYEAAEVRRTAPELLDRFYHLSQTFDQRPTVAAIPFMPGRGYLVNDAYFEVYQRVPGWPEANGVPVKRRHITAADLIINEVYGGKASDAGAALPAHAPSRLTFKKPREARWLVGNFAIAEGAYNKPKDKDNESTDGAVFTIVWVHPNGSRQQILNRALNPRSIPADRGYQPFNLELPLDEEGTLELITSPGPSNSNAYDWTQWSSLMLVFPEDPITPAR